MHRLYCITGTKQYDITPIAGTVHWQSTLDELAVKLNFSIAYNDDRLFPLNPVDLGSLIILYNQSEVFRGIVITEQKNGRGEISYTCVDYAFYLNKSKEIYQFNGIAADAAIKKILSDFNVPTGFITSIPVPITKIYPGEVVSDIIKDILDQAEKAAGIKYRMEMKAGKLFIQKQADLFINPTFQLAYNLVTAPCTRAVSNPTRTRSIENLKNSIKIIANNQVIAEVKDDSLIAKYGLLQEVKAQEGNGQAQMIAANLLKEMGRVFEENSIELPGNDEVRAGRIIELEEPVTGMKGKYLIKDAGHTLQGGIHTMNLGLEVI